MNKNIKDNEKLRDSFNDLATRTFDLSFKDWYQGGYWTNKYIPYALLNGEKVVANASVNIIDTIWQGQPKRYIQLGTIMTDIKYRNKGLSRRLIETILDDWKDKCDAVYLFANDTVLDFYPRFGFQKEIEYQYSMSIIPQTGNVRRLDMSNSIDRDLLAKYYGKSNPFSAFPMLGSYGLLMFYCSAFMKDCVYYCKDFDAIVIAMQNGEELICFDIYCDNNKPIIDIVSAIADKEVKSVLLGFTPMDTKHCNVNAISGDGALFILKGKDNIFANNKLMFPVLSHA